MKLGKCVDLAANPGPVYASHFIKPTSIELPSLSLSAEAKFELYNIDRNITQLKNEQYKVRIYLSKYIETRGIRKDIRL